MHRGRLAGHGEAAIDHQQHKHRDRPMQAFNGGAETRIDGCGFSHGFALLKIEPVSEICPNGGRDQVTEPDIAMLRAGMTRQLDSVC